MNSQNRPFSSLVNPAKGARSALGLRYRQVVIRNERIAAQIAARCPGHAVMLGEGAYRVVCLADAARLERAGYEWAPSTSSN